MSYYTPDDWRDVDPLLGKVSDRQLSMRFPMVSSTIRMRRMKLGIPVFTEKYNNAHRRTGPLLLSVVEIQEYFRKWVRSTALTKRINDIESWNLAMHLLRAEKVYG